MGRLRRWRSQNLSKKDTRVIRNVPVAHMAARIAVLVDPNNATMTETTVQDVQKAAPTMGLQIAAGSKERVGNNKRASGRSRSNAAKTSLISPTVVGAGKQRLRHCKTECLRGFEIDYQLILCRRLYRQIGWLLTLEDAIDVTGCAAVLTEFARVPNGGLLVVGPGSSMSQHRDLVVTLARPISPHRTMSAFGTKRTFASTQPMSAIGGNPPSDSPLSRHVNR